MAETLDADEVLNRVRATTWDDEHDRETFAMSRPAALELLSRLSRPAPAPEAGTREAAEREACYALIRSELDATEAALKNATGAFFEECLVARKVLQHAAEKIAARRLGASGKAGWTKEIPRGKYGDRLPFWWRDDTYSKRIVEMVIGVDGVASHPTWAITPTSEWLPIHVPEDK